MSSKAFICCICYDLIVREHGHDPRPIKDEGKCCDVCNYIVVVPARMKLQGDQSNGKEQ